MSCASNITSGFIDLATFDELEKYLYGGSSATAYFVRETRKSTWFTQVPVCLSRNNGNAEFNSDHSVSISRAGDYLLQAWLRVQIPAVTASTTGAALLGNVRIGWTPNLMHNLVSECSVSFNDLVAARFDSYHLDFWSAFTVPAGKRNGYDNMIGNVASLYQPALELPATTLNLPLPFWFARDSGVALPTAALPYNEMRISYTFRAWNELLTTYDATNTVVPAPSVLADIGGTAPVLGTVQTWANYAIVSNDERKRMACAPRNILIEQAQTAPLHTMAPTTNTQPAYDIRFSHAIKVIFFAVRNASVGSYWSNYVVSSPVVDTGLPLATSVDPIIATSLTYENTNRLQDMGSDYFSLVQPWFHAPVIPNTTGYHMYSYSLDFICLDPKGSTNYGKLTNVTITPTVSNTAVLYAGPTGSAGPVSAGLGQVQVYRFLTTVVNNNIIRISGGALGFPVL